MRFLRENGLRIFFGVDLPRRLVGQALAGHADFNHDQLAAPRRPDLARALRHVVGVRRRRDGELAVGVPAVHALHPRHRLAAAARLAGVQGARQGRAASPTRTSRSARTPRSDSPRWARVGGLRTRAVLELAAARHGRRSGWRRGWRSRSPGHVAYNAEQLDHHGRDRELVAATSAPRTSGTARCRTGSRSSSPSARWPILSVYLRQRGSPESKPVGAPHEATGVEG